MDIQGMILKIALAVVLVREKMDGVPASEGTLEALEEASSKLWLAYKASERELGVPPESFIVCSNCGCRTAVLGIACPNCDELIPENEYPLTSSNIDAAEKFLE